MLRVEAALLRAVLPDLVLREGMKVVASVAERAGQKGIIVLAGTPLAAQLPDEVQVGDVLRLIVAETGGERVVLRIIDGPQAPQQPPPPAVAVPLPGGMQARITVTERDESDGRSGGDGEQHEVRLTYASARLVRWTCTSRSRPAASCCGSTSAPGRACRSSSPSVTAPSCSRR